MKNFILALTLLFSVISYGQNESAETPKIGIKIPKGETVEIKGVSVKFVEVLEDSRCPTGTNCIWAGRARVKIMVTNNGETTEKILTFGATQLNEEENTNVFSNANFAINGLTLSPYPTTQNTGEKEYTLLVCEDKNN